VQLYVIYTLCYYNMYLDLCDTRSIEIVLIHWPVWKTSI